MTQNMDKIKSSELDRRENKDFTNISLIQDFKSLSIKLPNHSPVQIIYKYIGYVNLLNSCE